MVEKVGNKNYTRKVMVLTTLCKKKFFVSVHDVISDMLNVNGILSTGHNCDAEYAKTESDHELLNDWLLGKMEWFKCKSLTHFNPNMDEEKMSGLKIESICFRVSDGPYLN